MQTKGRPNHLGLASSFGAVLAVLGGCGATSARFVDPGLRDDGVRHAGRYDVRWSEHGEGCHDSMPVGNGDVGLNVWTEGDDSLHFYIGKTDAWGDNARLLKVGEVVVRFPAASFTGRFEQRLDLAGGRVLIDCGVGSDAVHVEVWVDAHRPVVHVLSDSVSEIPIDVSYRLWREEPEALDTFEVGDVFARHPSVGQFVVQPDVELDGLPSDQIGWYHHNADSHGVRESMAHQGIAGDPGFVDLVKDRVFGAVVRADGAERSSPRDLAIPARERHSIEIFVQTSFPSDPDRWRGDLEASMRAASDLPLKDRRERHLEWWADFWERSFIVADGPERLLPPSGHALRFGLDQHGGNRFTGEVDPISPVPSDFEKGLLIRAEVVPDRDEPTGRVFDRITPGGSDGFLLDFVRPGVLRLIVGDRTKEVGLALHAGRRSRIELAASTEAGWRALVDGVEVFRSGPADPVDRDDAHVVSRGYTLQRFVNACGARGSFPVKFNGSIFNVAWDGRPGDADYRRWGSGYWWQNTRLPYVGMPLAGDAEMMHSLFELYAGRMFEAGLYRTRIHHGFEGALYYNECIHPWGACMGETYGWNVPFAERDDPLQASGWHKWEWVAGPELCSMMFDYVDFTGDEVFLVEKVLPVSEAVMRWFELYYETDESGRLVMYPSMACETWWDCTNPQPEIAGLHALVLRMERVPEGLLGSERRVWLDEFAQKLLPLPIRETPDGPAFAPAERFDVHNNVENPELYPVFPFRLVGAKRGDRSLAVNALEHRWHRGHSGWRQDDLFMALLGLTDQARGGVVGRARAHDRSQRFPAFWGPNYDWTPDQTHGGVLMATYQAMLLQCDPYSDSLHLMPAWPRDWNVEFRLHAPRGTLVEGAYRDGKLCELAVTPASRREDLVLPGWLESL
ncbi:MAG: DUF5703 domain-containing protein [Planctomycetota bacterium]